MQGQDLRVRVHSLQGLLGASVQTGLVRRLRLKLN
nr:MAG TPA: hypothetical protein [Caudoviricetes sp.]DAW11035.1 MAG TPA: hypothetical protein [Caudoviricetes sp.]